MAPDPFPPGALVGTYEVIRPLSAGGNAQVYVAWDPGLHREVALKVLSTNSLGDPDRLARIQKEARVLDLEGGQSEAAGELAPGVEMLGWTRDGQDLLVVEPGQWPLRVDRRSLRNGGRTFVRELGTAGGPAPARVDRVRMSPDGQAFAHSVLRVTLSDLLVAQGLE